jgi:hypothetical protein
MSPYEGGIDDQIFEVRIVGHRLENARPNTLHAPPAETPEYAVPVAERLWKVTPGRASPHDPKHALHKHPVVAAEDLTNSFVRLTNLPTPLDR